LNHSLLTIEDLNFNCILIRANHCLKTIAKTIDSDLPPELLASMQKTKDALEQLWDAYSGQYYSRNYATHKLIKVPSIATLLPLYAGSITDERAEHLVRLLRDNRLFSAKYPVPTVPMSSDWFKPSVYWQGPTWVNTNWLIIEGLKRYGFDKEAAELREQTINLVREQGFSEYFSPLDGHPLGVNNFSWTAALTIDLIEQK
jgi:glycogen debranching enzyme